MFNRKYIYIIYIYLSCKGPFSIAMIVYWSNVQNPVDIPLNSDCLIGILIMAYYKSSYNWVV